MNIGINFLVRNCWILVWLLFGCTSVVSAQDKDTVVLACNAGVATYLNKNPGVNLAVSFKGDTIYDAGVRSGMGMGFMVDSCFVQITKYRIPEDRFSDKFDNQKEKALLDHFRNYELEYFQSEAFKTPLKNESSFFENSWGKQFQLWSFDIPLLDRRAANGAHQSVKQHLFLSFVANNYVIMVNMLVLEDESKETKVAILKEQVANSIRIFPAPAMDNILQEQLVYHKLGKPFIAHDSLEGIQLTIPYWLNVMEGPYYLHGVFPDVNNVSNALLVMLVDKSRFKSVDDFRDQWAKGRKGVQSPKKVKSDNDKLLRYNFSDKTPYGHFKGQNVFFESKSSYGLISFTATDNTFDKNIGRFEEFLSTIEIGPF